MAGDPPLGPRDPMPDVPVFPLPDAPIAPSTLDEIRDGLKQFGRGIGAVEPEASKKLNVEMVQLQRAAQFSKAVTDTTNSVVGAVSVFKDPGSRDSEKAAAVSNCFASFSQVAVLAGPVGMAVGTVISMFLGVISTILEATGEHRATMMEQLESKLRELKAEDEADEVNAARSMINRQQSAVGAFEDRSRTWNELMATAPLTHDISEFKLAKAGEWLKRRENQKVKGWEEVFVGYSYALVDVFELHVNGLEKLKTDEDRAIMMGELKALGKQVNELLDKLEENVVVLGSQWHIGTDTFGYFADDFNKYYWEDINVGPLGSIVVSRWT